MEALVYCIINGKVVKAARTMRGRLEVLRY
jgi:hypothetical protein